MPAIISVNFTTQAEVEGSNPPDNKSVSASVLRSVLNAGQISGGYVTLAGTETITGTKTFTNTIAGSINGNAATVTNGVYTIGNQTIGGTKTFSSTIVGSIDGNAAGNGVPIGTVVAMAVNTPPTGWLPCNGASLSTIGAYNALFLQIGYAFGGAGAAFSLPDLRGEFIRGVDGGRGVDSGRIFGTAQSDGIAQHQHKYLDRTPESSNSSAPYQGSSYGAQGFAAGGPLFRNNLVRNTLVENSTPAWATDTRPRNVALLYCIKF